MGRLVTAIYKFLTRHKVRLAVGILLAALYLFLGLQAIWYGPFNPDEGFYLYDAWRLGNGDIPYRDFAFHQPPLVLVPHAFFQELIGPGFYLGRLVNLGIGALVIIFTYLVARQLHGEIAGILAAATLAGFPWFIVHMATVSTYAITALIVLATLWTFNKKKYFLTGFLLIAIVWSRFSLFPASLVIALAAAIRGIRHKNTAEIRTLAGALVAVVVLIGPFVLWIPEHTWANIVYHNTFTHQDTLTTDTQVLHAKLGKAYELFKSNYWPLYRWPWLFVLVGLAGALWRDRLSKIVVIATIALLTALLQAPATNVTYDVPLLPLLSIIGSVGVIAVVSRLQNKTMRSLALPFLFILVILCGFLPQQYLLDGRLETELYGSDVRRVVQYIRTHTQPDDFLFTPELYLAVEAQRPVLPGLGIGRFFFFPEFSTSQAAVSNVLTSDQLWQTIASREAKLLIFHQQHWWRSIQHEGSVEEVLGRIEASGYHQVKSLQNPPAIEEIMIYERD